MDVFSLFVCAFAGGAAGHRIWDAWLGACTGLAGGLGYKMFMRVIWIIIKRKINGNGSEQEKVSGGAAEPTD